MDCIFDNYMHAACWQGCDIQFWEGVKLAKKVISPSLVDDIAAQGNTPEARTFITEAVQTLKTREAARIEEIRTKLEVYDKHRQSAPLASEPDPTPEPPSATSGKKK